MIKILTALVTLLFMLTSSAYAADIQESTDSFGPFGTLPIYKNSDQPKNVVLFIAGDGGWH